MSANSITEGPDHVLTMFKCRKQKNSYRVPVHTSKYTGLTISVWARCKISINLTRSWKWKIFFIHCWGLLSTVAIWIQGHRGHVQPMGQLRAPGLSPKCPEGSWDTWRCWDLRAILQRELGEGGRGAAKRMPLTPTLHSGPRPESRKDPLGTRALVSSVLRAYRCKSGDAAVSETWESHWQKAR